MKNKKLLNLSNLLYAIGILFALGVYLKSYIDKSRLPEGMCPIDNNRGLMFVAIIILVIITIITSVIDYFEKKKEIKENKEDNKEENI